MRLFWTLDKAASRIDALLQCDAGGWCAWGVPTSAGRMVGASVVVVRACPTCPSGARPPRPCTRADARSRVRAVAYAVSAVLLVVRCLTCSSGARPACMQKAAPQARPLPTSIHGLPVGFSEGQWRGTCMAAAVELMVLPVLSGAPDAHPSTPKPFIADLQSEGSNCARGRG